MKILIYFVGLSVVSSVYADYAWNDEKKIEVGWAYTKQIMCQDLAFYATDYLKSEIHEKKSKKMLNEIVVAGKMEEDEFSGWRSRAIGITEGIEMTLRIYDNKNSSQYKKIYDLSKCD